MNLENEAYLKQVFPKLLVNRGKLAEGEVDGPYAYWGFECGDGWFNLINILLQNIQSHCDWKKDTCPQVVVQQVKEKFGTLRFYYSGGDEYVAGLVALAESISGIMCESCGSPATTSSVNPETGISGWINTTCSSCKAKREQI